MTATIFGDDTDPKVATTAGTVMKYYEYLLVAKTVIDVSSAFTFVPGTNSLFVSVNGAWKVPTVDYTENADGKGITFLASQGVGSKILIWGLINITNETIPDTAIQFSGVTPTSPDNSYAWDAQFRTKNSKSFPYFCKGDNINDDTTALQALFASGGKVHLSAGSYLFSQTLSCTSQVTADPGVNLFYIGAPGNVLISLDGNNASLQDFVLDDLTGPASGNVGVQFNASYCTTKNIVYGDMTICEEVINYNTKCASINCKYSNYKTSLKYWPQPGKTFLWESPLLSTPDSNLVLPLIDVRSEGLSFNNVKVIDGGGYNKPILSITDLGSVVGDITATNAGYINVDGSGFNELSITLKNCSGSVSTVSAGTVTLGVYIKATGLTTISKVNCIYDTYAANTVGVFNDFGASTDIKSLYVNKRHTGLKCYGNLNCLFPRLYNCTQGILLAVGSVNSIVRAYYSSCTSTMSDSGTSTII